MGIGVAWGFEAIFEAEDWKFLYGGEAVVLVD